MDKDLDLRAKEGTYTLTFSESGASSNRTEIEIDIQDDMEIAFKLLCASDKVTVETIYVELKHTAGDDQAAVPDSSSKLKYKNYKEVEAQFRDAGFTDISTEAQYDIIWGWTDEGEVAEVSIDGNTDFARGDIFSADAPVIIMYHMKNEDDPTDRTYEGIVYDRAYYRSDNDGLKRRVHTYYLFNETDGLALYISHSTTASGKTVKLYGTYSGSFDDEVIVAFDTSNGTVEHLLYQEGGIMYAQTYENDKKSFSLKDVKSSIIDFRNW